MVQKLPHRNGQQPLALRSGVDLARASRRYERVQKIGRDLTYAYVHDGYKRHLRSDPHYRKYHRVLDRLSVSSMSADERHILQAMGGVVMAAKIDRANVGKIKGPT